MNKVNNKEYVECYGCHGINLCLKVGVPWYGCLLCERFGDGKGNLLKEYSDIHLTILYKDFCGNRASVTYDPVNKTSQYN